MMAKHLLLASVVLSGMLPLSLPILHFGTIFFPPYFGTKLVSITFSLRPGDIVIACIDTCMIFCFAILDKFISQDSRMRNLHFRLSLMFICYFRLGYFPL